MTTENQLELLIQHIRKEVELNQDDIAALASIARYSRLNKKECLLQPGKISQHMNFITEGAMRTYYVDDTGQEHSLQLGVEEWWINDLHSYLTGAQSNMYVQALEKTNLIRLPKAELENLFFLRPAFSHFFRLKIQSAYVALQERMLEKMSDNAFERYQNFRKKYRNIEQRVPQYIVASYLGVTPEFLSHLRNKHR